MLGGGHELWVRETQKFYSPLTQKNSPAPTLGSLHEAGAGRGGGAGRRGVGGGGQCTKGVCAQKMDEVTQIK